jgi:hypothetical protein
MQALGDIVWRSRPHHHACDDIDLAVGDAGLRRGRHIGQCGGPFVAHHRERAKLAVFDLRCGRRQRGEAHRRMTGNRGVDRRRAAAEGHVDEVETERRAEQLAGEMPGRAKASRGDSCIFRDWLSPAQ